MDEAVKADRVVVFEKGEIKLDDTPREVFKNLDLIKSLHIDAPQSTQLIDMLDVESEQTVLNADECAKLIYKKLKEN
jgi:energy-coupling factor transport system ATP-binding protein